MTTINVRIDEQTKEGAQRLFSELGLDMTTAINIFLKRALLEQGLPFDVSKRTYNAETIAALSEYAEMKANPEKYKRYSSFKEALDELDEVE